MKPVIEALMVLIIGTVVSVVFALIILIRTAQGACNLLGETDGQHGN